MNILIGIGYLLLALFLAILLFSPVIFAVVAIIMTLCGKYHVLKMWLKKHGFSSKHTLIHQFNDSKFQKENFHEIADFKSHGRIDCFDKEMSSAFSAPLFDNDFSSRTNPASGLPMIGSSSLDSGGNIFGTRKF